jgi:hypothetical protein
LRQSSRSSRADMRRRAAHPAHRQPHAPARLSWRFGQLS